jgi:glycosyltransferase involved in cell wall biosynthesis
LAARLAGVPARVSAVTGLGYVFTSDDRLARLLRPLLHLLMRISFGGKFARLILQNADDLTVFLKAGYVKEDRLRLIRGSGVDCTRFLEPSARAAEQPFTVLLAARLLWDKGLAEYVSAARKLRQQGREIRFVLAGAPDHGNPASVSEETVRGWERAGYVEWVGHVDDMPKLFGSADIVVLPSYYREGVPKSLIEAAACGRALITADAPGCREVVTDGVEGLLVPPRDSDALAMAIARLHDDPLLAGRLGRAARAKALVEFDEQIVIARTLAVYDEVCGERFARPDLSGPKDRGSLIARAW